MIGDGATDLEASPPAVSCLLHAYLILCILSPHVSMLERNMNVALRVSMEMWTVVFTS